MARKPKLTAEMIGQIETALQNHNTVEATCGMIGISRESFYRWLREGEATNTGLKRDFHDAVKRAQGMSQIMLVNQIAKDPSWQAKAWLLERLHPKLYGRRQLIAHAGADGESDLPAQTGTPTAVNLTIKMAGTEKQDGDELAKPPGGQWIVKPEQDPEPQSGSDPWPTDGPGWDKSLLPDQPTKDPAARAAIEAAKAGETPAPAPAPERAPHAAPTGGKPRDPDDP